MKLQTMQVVNLFDGQNRHLGQVTIERIEDDTVLGVFTQGPEFPLVEPLFTEFVEAANEQMFHRVDELDRAIAALGLHLSSANGVPFPDICDVQIADDNISFRICGPSRSGPLTQAKIYHP